jgi:hypothetical protein
LRSTLTLSGNPITADDQFVDWYARVWDSAVAGSLVRDTRISASVAASDVITVASVGGVTTSHYVEFIQLDGGGELPSYLEHPTYVQAPTTGYGVKVGDLEVARAFGVTQFIENAWMREWSNGANPPDGWAVTTALGGSKSRNTNTDYTRYGGYSLYVDGPSPSAIIITTPRFDFVRTQAMFFVSIRAQIYFAGFAQNGGNIKTFRMRLMSLDPSGALNTTIATDTVQASDGTGTATVVATGEWISMEIAGAFLTDSTAPYGMAVTFDITGIPGEASTCQAYLDTVEAYGFEALPDGIFEFGDATILHQSANEYLATNAAPIESYDVTISDLERASPSSWSRNALTLGGNVRIVDSDVSIDRTVRLIRLERDLLKPSETTLTLATRQALLTELVTIT